MHAIHFLISVIKTAWTQRANMSFNQDKLQFYYMTSETRVRYACLKQRALQRPGSALFECQYAVLWNQTENAVMTRIFKSSVSDQCSM